MNSNRSDSISVVICAAGASKRFGVKKEYQKIDSKPDSLTVLGSCVRTFASVKNVDTIVIAIPENDEENARRAIPEKYLNSTKPKIIFTNGDSSRQGSVFFALRALKQYKPDFVLIHDGARPFVSLELIQSVIEGVRKHGAAIPVIPFTDTPKVYKDGFITKHLKRESTGAAQTPQGFKFKKILMAHEKASCFKRRFTDDAEVWGKFVGSVAVVPGEADNRKITFKEDLI